MAGASGAELERRLTDDSSATVQVRRSTIARIHENDDGGHAHVAWRRRLRALRCGVSTGEILLVCAPLLDRVAPVPAH